MRRLTAVWLAAALTFQTMVPAARALAQAAEPFPEVPLPRPSTRSHVWAYAAFASGLALVGASFALGDRANDHYDDYLAATDPDEIEDLYQRTRRADAWSTTTLLGGEALIGVGIYLRFLRLPRDSRLTVGVGAERCALSLRF